MLREAGSPMAIVGNLNIDLWVQTIERFPAWSEERIVDSARVELAGTAGYLMLACQALGIEPVVVSTVGDDLFGRFLQDELQSRGFAGQGVEVLTGEETPLSLIFVGQGGQRGILSTLGAHRLMNVEIVRRHDQRIAPCRELFLCGNYLLPGLAPARILSYAREARARGQVVVFDPSWDPGGWGEQTRRDTYRLLEEVSVYLPNEEELTHLTGRGDWRAALAEVAALAGEVVLKRGAQGAVYAGPEGQIEAPALAVDAVNTIGAGDVFDVAYLYARRRGWEPRRRLEFACAMAALVVAQPGARSYPAAGAVLALLHERTGDRFWRSIDN